MVDLPRPAMSTCSVNSVPARNRPGSSESGDGLERDARGTKLFQVGHVEVSRRLSSTGWGRALMVVVARIVNEAPDCEPQCGVGMGGISSAFTLSLFLESEDVMLVMMYVVECACAVYVLPQKGTRARGQ